MDENGIRVRRSRSGQPKVPVNTLAVHEGSVAGRVVGSVSVGKGYTPSRQQVNEAWRLKQLADEVLRADELAHLVDERTIERLEACADVLGPLWVETLMRDLETGACDRYALRLHDAEDVSEQLDWARVTLQLLELRFREVPKWLSPELVVLLLHKLSFGRGGGTGAAMSPENMRKRLRDPRKMAKWIRAQPERSSRFSNELGALDQACTKPKVKFTRSTKPADLVDERWFRAREA